MMRDTLCDYGAATLEHLRGRGCKLTDADVIEINALASEVADKGRFTEKLSRGRPVHCGGAWLWPLTLQASDWFDNTGCFMSDGRAALGYAMSHGEDEALPTVSKREVKKWLRGLRCTMSQLVVAMHEIMEQDDSPDLTRPNDEKKTGGGMSAGRLSAVMVARCGGTPEQWERRVSVDYLRTILETLSEQAAAEGGSTMDSQTLKAEDALDACVCRIEGRGENG